jgi:hypothetical protein
VEAESPPPGDVTSQPPPGGATLELLVHGVGGTTPEEMLDDPRTVRVTGDGTAAVFRRADDVEAERAEPPGRARAGGTGDGRAPVPPVQEAYVWCNLTSGNGSRALWLLLLPFMVVNLAHWMRPATHGNGRAVRLHGMLVRLAGLSLTVLLVAAACEVALDLTAWQCAGTAACAAAHSWLGFLTDGWWSAPGRRLALAAVVPTALTLLLWYLSHRTWSAYEAQQPLAGAEREEYTDATPLGRPGFWYGRRLVARLRAAHTAAALLTVAAAVAAARGPATTVPRAARPFSTCWGGCWRPPWPSPPSPWSAWSAGGAAASTASTTPWTPGCSGSCRSAPPPCCSSPWCTPAGPGPAGVPPGCWPGTRSSGPSASPKGCWWWHWPSSPAPCTAPAPTPAPPCAASPAPPSPCWPARSAA